MQSALSARLRAGRGQRRGLPLSNWSTNQRLALPQPDFLAAPVMEVVVEIPRWSFLKRGSTGRVDFVSPLPCPFNYGAIPQFIGLEGDLLDAVVLGARLPLGSVVQVRAVASIALTDRGMTDDKLICCDRPPSVRELRDVARFFHFYARCKALLNRYRGLPGRNACDGWLPVDVSLRRARIRDTTSAMPQASF